VVHHRLPRDEVFEISDRDLLKRRQAGASFPQDQKFLLYVCPFTIMTSVGKRTTDGSRRIRPAQHIDNLFHPDQRVHSRPARRLSTKHLMNRSGDSPQRPSTSAAPSSRPLKTRPLRCTPTHPWASTRCTTSASTSTSTSAWQPSAPSPAWCTSGHGISAETSSSHLASARFHQRLRPQGRRQSFSAGVRGLRRADITSWSYLNSSNVSQFDIIWASAPCTEYSPAKTPRRE
jgi:hypothetical protein